MKASYKVDTSKLRWRDEDYIDALNFRARLLTLEKNGFATPNNSCFFSLAPFGKNIEVQYENEAVKLKLAGGAGFRLYAFISASAHIFMFHWKRDNIVSTIDFKPKYLEKKKIYSLRQLLALQSVEVDFDREDKAAMESKKEKLLHSIEAAAVGSLSSALVLAFHRKYYRINVINSHIAPKKFETGLKLLASAFLATFFIRSWQYRSVSLRLSTSKRFKSHVDRVFKAYYGERAEKNMHEINTTEYIRNYKVEDKILFKLNRESDDFPKYKYMF